MLGSLAAINASSYDYVPRAELACDGDVPYAAWIESQLGPSANWRRRVSHFNPHTNEWSSNAIWNVPINTGRIGITIAGATPYVYNDSSVFTAY